MNDKLCIIIELKCYLALICRNPTKECSGEEFCAETKSELECTQLGNVLGTDFKCHWLTRSESIHGIPRNYETCTSNKETCPDGECDELETQHWELCPQDCTRKLFFFLFLFFLRAKLFI